MKKIKSLIVLSLMLFVGGQMMAQTRGALFLGAGFPVKDFAEFEGFNDFALTTADLDEDDGGAGIGFNAGLKWYFNVGVKGLGVMLSVDGFYNGPSSELKTAYRERETQIGNQYLGGSFAYEAKPKYINVPAMLGLNYIYHVNPKFGIYLEAGAGGNLGFITNMETTNTRTILGVETRTKSQQSYENALSFAYQAGIGFEVARNLLISCSFYDFGKREVKGEEIVKTTTLNDNVTNSVKNYNTFGTLHPIMIVGRIGFSF